eukprot:2870431-Amphidinium_carterae.1
MPFHGVATNLLVSPSPRLLMSPLRSYSMPPTLKEEFWSAFASALKSVADVVGRAISEALLIVSNIV